MHHHSISPRPTPFTRATSVAIVGLGLAGLVASCTPYYARGTVRGEYRTSAVVTVAEPQPVYVEPPRVVVVARAPEPVYVPPPRVVIVAPEPPRVVVTAPPPPAVEVRVPAPPSVSVRVHAGGRGRGRGRGPE